MKLICVAGIFLLGVVLHRSSAATITFEANPYTIQPVLTKTLQLRCAVTATSPAQSLVVGRRQAASNSSVDADITHVTSFVILHLDTTSGTFEAIATVSTYDPPTAHTSLGKVAHVDGDTELSPVPSEMGYLSITYEYPYDEEAGTYKCEVSAIDTSFHPVTLDTMLEVTLSEPALQDLVEYVAKTDKYITDLQKINLELQNTSMELLKSVADLKTQMLALQQQSNAQVATIQMLQNQTKPFVAQNVQTGIVSTCSDQTVAFPLPFSSPPTVFLSVIQEEHSHGSSPNNHGWYDVSSSSVTAASFNLECSWSSNFYDITISWLAIGE